MCSLKQLISKDLYIIMILMSKLKNFINNLYLLAFCAQTLYCNAPRYYTINI